MSPLRTWYGTDAKLKVTVYCTSMVRASTGVPGIQILCVVQVFFPAETPDQSLPRWFFDRSPSEVKAAFLAKRNNDELDKVRLILSHFLFI